jgi:hypothetical protein
VPFGIITALVPFKLNTPAAFLLKVVSVPIVIVAPVAVREILPVDTVSSDRVNEVSAVSPAFLRENAPAVCFILGPALLNCISDPTPINPKFLILAIV